jgi:hypothetical protein
MLGGELVQRGGHAFLAEDNSIKTACRTALASSVETHETSARTARGRRPRRT